MVTNRCRTAIRQNVEGNMHLLNLLCDSVRPEGIAILAVQGKGFLNSLRDFYAKLVGPFEIPATATSSQRAPRELPELPSMTMTTISGALIIQ